jgi:hypothetical protein
MANKLMKPRGGDTLSPQSNRPRPAKTKGNRDFQKFTKGGPKRLRTKDILTFRGLSALLTCLVPSTSYEDMKHLIIEYTDHLAFKVKCEGPDHAVTFYKSLYLQAMKIAVGATPPPLSG